MKSKTILLFVLFLSFGLTAQEFNVPDNASYDSDTDYTSQEQNVLSAINWLMVTPVSEQQVKRKSVNAFLMQWMTGSPTVTIEITQAVAPFMECADCLMAFLSGWTKYSLENAYSKDRVAGALAGVNHTIAFYEANKKSLGTNSEIEKLIRKKEKGDLKSHIKAAF